MNITKFALEIKNHYKFIDKIRNSSGMQYVIKKTDIQALLLKNNIMDKETTRKEAGIFYANVFDEPHSQEKKILDIDTSSLDIRF